MWRRKTLVTSDVPREPLLRFPPSLPLVHSPRPRRPERDHPEGVTHIGHTFRANRCHSGVRMGVVGVRKGNKKAPQVSVFVGLVYCLCSGCVRAEVCRRGDLNPTACLPPKGHSMDNHRTPQARRREKPVISPCVVPGISHKRDTAEHLKHAHSMQRFPLACD